MRVVLFIATALPVFAVSLTARSVEIDASRLLRQAQGVYGQKAESRVSNWLRALEEAAAMPSDRQLNRINRFWNSSLRGFEDVDLWGVEDHWATPLEALGRGAGDCEDYVIGKYFSLLYLGVPADKLRLIYVRAQVGGRSIAHMVLGYYETPSSDPLILDSLTSTIARASHRRDLTPVFSFNAQGIYVAGRQHSVESISRWQDLLARMQTEGIQP